MPTVVLQVKSLYLQHFTAIRLREKGFYNLTFRIKYRFVNQTKKEKAVKPSLGKCEIPGSL